MSVAMMVYIRYNIVVMYVYVDCMDGEMYSGYSGCIYIVIYTR